MTKERFVDVYEDTGCRSAPSCLSCPFAQCKYDRPDRIRRAVENGDEAPLYRPHEIPDRIGARAGLPSMRRKA